MLNFMRALIVSCVVLAVVVAVDYQSQAEAHGVRFGEMGVEIYADTVSERLSQPSVPRVALTAFLPKPKGAWRQVAKDRDTSRALREGATMAGLAAEAPQQQKTPEGAWNLMAGPTGWVRGARHSRVYLRDREIIEITVKRKIRRSGIAGGQQALTESVAARISGQADQELFGRIGGVRYIETKDPFTRVPHIRNIRGTLGDAATISIRARANPASIRKILAGIDYDGLVAQLDGRVNGVGNAAIASLPQVKTRETRSIERRKLSVESEAKADSAYDRFRAMFGYTAPEAKPVPSVQIRRGNTRSTCSRLASECGGKMSAASF